MKINKEGLEKIRKTIGETNYCAGKKLLADGGEMFFFTSVEEMEKDAELTKNEKEFCFHKFEAGEGWAGITRSKMPVVNHPSFGLLPASGNWSH